MASIRSGRNSNKLSTTSNIDIDALSWEGPSMIKTQQNSVQSSKTSSNLVNNQSHSSNVPSANASTVSTTASASHSHYSNSTEVSGASQHTTSRSEMTAQTLRQDVNIWFDVKAQFPSLANYFQEMQLDQQISELLANLFKLKQLPFSPYSQMMCDLRSTMERYQQASIDFSQLSTINDGEVVLPWPGSVLANCDNLIWGIPSLLPWIYPPFILQYEWLLKNIEESFRPLYQLNYEIKPIVCLSGATIFGGGLLSQPPLADVRIEVIITGESEQKAIELYARQVVRELKSTTSDINSLHLLINVTVKDRKYNLDNIQSNEEEFREMIEQSTHENTSITAQFVFAMDDACTSYQFGMKTYTLNFVKSAASDSQVKVFADSQYKTLYSSLVLGEAGGRRYATLFSPGLRPARKLQAIPTRLSINQLENGSDQLDTQPSAINQKEVDKLVQSWKKQVAKIDENSSLLLILDKLILLYCVHSVYDSQLLVQIYNISHSPSHWLQLVTVGCGYLLKVVHSRADKNSDIVLKLFNQLKKLLSDLFNPLLWEQTSDMKSYESDLANQISKIDPTSGDHKELTCLHHYLQGIMLGSMQHVLSACPILKKTILNNYKSCSKSKEQADNRNKQVKKTKGKDHDKKSNIDNNKSHDHGDVVTDDYTNCFLDIDQLQKFSKFPASVAKDAILLQYVVDCRVDECMRAFIAELLTCVALPRNPYSILFSLLKQHHWKLCLWQQTDTELNEKLKHNKEQLDVPSSFLFRIAKEELFGCAAILRVASSTHVNSLVTTVLEDYRNNKYIRVKGLLKVKTSTCLTGPAVLYGSVLPHLLDVIVHEHYVITSTWRNQEQQSSQLQLAISLMSEIVATNVTQLINLHGLICTGVQIGSSSWSAGDVTSKQDQFNNELYDILNNKQAIVFKSLYLLNGGYICVCKHFCMHFCSEVGATPNSYETFYPTSLWLYYTSVFTNRDKALDLYEWWFEDDPDPVAPSNMIKLTSELDKLVLDNWNCQKILPAYRYLLIRSLITQQWSQVREAWYMLHSMASELEYIQHLCDILQQLALLPSTCSPDLAAMATMINSLSNKLCSLLTNASNISITSITLLNYFTDILQPYKSPAKLGKEVSDVFSKISVMIMPLMTTIFQDIHAVCKENDQLMVSLNVSSNSQL